MERRSVLALSFVGSVVAWIVLSLRRKRINARGLGSSHPSLSVSDYKNCVYLDYNATTPIWEEVSEAMQPYTLLSFGNPSSPHVYANPCREALQRGRDHISKLINVDPQCLIMTSCGSESDNRAIDIALATGSQRDGLPHIIASCIEHPAILEYLKFLFQSKRIEFTLLPVNEEGYVSPEDVTTALKDSTALVTVMHSNNEVGTLQPIQEIAKRVQEFNESLQSRGVHRPPVLFHSDAAQSIGKVAVDVQSLGVDMMTLVGHKFGAPKGIAALYVRSGIPVQPLLFGGGQECGRRAGTENVLLTVGMGEASRIALVEFPALVAHLLRLRLLLISQLMEVFKDKIRFNGPSKAYSLSEISSQLLRLQAAPSSMLRGIVISQSLGVLLNTVSVSFRDIKVASDVIPRIGDKVACSAGAACHSLESQSVSSVLLAIQVPKEFQLGTLRLSFGRHTTQEEVLRAVAELAKAVGAASQSP